MVNKHLEAIRRRRESNAFWRELFCRHKWIPGGEVASNWYKASVKLPAECSKCGKESQIRSSYFNEWPDDLINSQLEYSNYL